MWRRPCADVWRRPCADRARARAFAVTRRGCAQDSAVPAELSADYRSGADELSAEQLLEAKLAFHSLDARNRGAIALAELQGVLSATHKAEIVRIVPASQSSGVVESDRFKRSGVGLPTISFGTFVSLVEEPLFGRGLSAQMGAQLGASLEYRLVDSQDPAQRHSVELKDVLLAALRPPEPSRPRGVKARLRNLWLWAWHGTLPYALRTRFMRASEHASRKIPSCTVKTLQLFLLPVAERCFETLWCFDVYEDAQPRTVLVSSPDLSCTSAEYADASHWAAGGLAAIAALQAIFVLKVYACHGYLCRAVRERTVEAEVCVGEFDTPEEAAHAYDRAVRAQASSKKSQQPTNFDEDGERSLHDENSLRNLGLARSGAFFGVFKKGRRWEARYFEAGGAFFGSEQKRFMAAQLRWGALFLRYRTQPHQWFAMGWFAIEALIKIVIALIFASEMTTQARVFAAALFLFGVAMMTDYHRPHVHLQDAANQRFLYHLLSVVGFAMGTELLEGSDAETSDDERTFLYVVIFGFLGVIVVIYVYSLFRVRQRVLAWRGLWQNYEAQHRRPRYQLRTSVVPSAATVGDAELDSLLIEWNPDWTQTALDNLVLSVPPWNTVVNMHDTVGRNQLTLREVARHHRSGHEVQDIAREFERGGYICHDYQIHMRKLDAATRSPGADVSAWTRVYPLEANASGAAIGSETRCTATIDRAHEYLIRLRAYAAVCECPDRCCRDGICREAECPLPICMLLKRPPHLLPCRQPCTLHPCPHAMLDEVHHVWRAQPAVTSAAHTRVGPAIPPPPQPPAAAPAPRPRPSAARDEPAVPVRSALPSRLPPRLPTATTNSAPSAEAEAAAVVPPRSQDPPMFASSLDSDDFRAGAESPGPATYGSGRLGAG